VSDRVTSRSADFVEGIRLSPLRSAARDRFAFKSLGGERPVVCPPSLAVGRAPVRGLKISLGRAHVRGRAGRPSVARASAIKRGGTSQGKGGKRNESNARKERVSMKARDLRIAIGTGRLALVAIAVLAMTLVGTASASAETEREKAEWQAFANCPAYDITIHGGEVTACSWGLSSYKERWASNKQKEEWEEREGRAAPLQLSHFTAGNVSVNLKLPITLKLGLAENPEEETQELDVVGARGAETIAAVAQRGPNLRKTVDSADLSGAELDRYNYYVRVAKQTKTTATIELAGPADALHLNLANLLGEEGNAFVFPVKVKLGNAFLGNDCYVGSDENPIVVPMTTGPSGELRGKAGTLAFNPEGTLLTVWGDTLVATGFEAPGVEGCGVEGGADEAVDAALGLPSASNTAVLNGILKQTGAETAEEHGAF
jgi:hypothetical protein